MTAKIPWNQHQKVGAKPPLTPDQVQHLRLHLQQSGSLRDQVMFSLAIDTLLRGSDLVKLKVSQVCDDQGRVKEVVEVTQQKTQQRVAVYLTPETQKLLHRYIQNGNLYLGSYIFPGKRIGSHLSVAMYRYICRGWFESVGFDRFKYGTHSLRRTKTSLIYQRTGNLRACQKLLGHQSIQHTALYLGVEEAEALELAREVRI